MEKNTVVKTTADELVTENDDKKVVLKVDHVAKFFKLPTEQASGLKQALINWTKGIKGFKIQHVLRDISFEVHEGDFFGIVGRNGSGKSTLLKLISQIYMPDGGTITVNGKLVPFIELGVGFNPELTGRENVYLNGALLGFSHTEIDDMYDDIVEFAELGEFMDQKLKNYSSGMQVRLAFSVAIKAQGDILVLDEVLAVGDESFQRKCDNYFAQIKKDPKKTVILVTHSMDAVKKYCNKAILIKDGEIVESGNKDDVADRYTLENLRASAEQHSVASPDSEYPLGLSKRVPVLKQIPVSSLVLKSSDSFVFDVEYEFNESTPYYLAAAVFDLKRGGISFDSGEDTFRFTEPGHHMVRFSLPLHLFNNGEYKVLVTLRVDKDKPTPQERTERLAFTNDANCSTFAIRDTDNGDYALINDRSLQFSIINSES
ncbi:ABC transporter ATP-binding protein [Bifidobacterium catulorum]|uniref:Sugar ABC transporter n=1 Tax=Bifidobacterium catulorum TaxID=1630173 RepID=A0A2U2MRG1_9BIFI|nr:ABC transporter ATP-binding protein [Bifidobacterium catulorum]PWG59423.1 sugar ABC transporter [Bifidobacterium catulorum]